MSEAPAPLILIVDDEPQMRRLLTMALETAGYRVVAAQSGGEGLALAAQQRPALVLLDLGLPDTSGQEILRRLREWSPVPVLILTALDSEAEKIALLDAGADDYVTKPFHTGELLARVRVALRHAAKDPGPPVYRSVPLVVDLASRRVTLHEDEVELTATEYALLRLLVRHAGRVLTHRMILREIWGPQAESQTHYLRVYVARLRSKLSPGAPGDGWICTESAVGYRWVEGPPESR